MLDFTLDLNEQPQAYEKAWELCVGSCHAATALRADYQAQLTRCQRELGFRYVRFHGLFDDDMSVATKGMFSPATTFSFVNIDKIFDFLLSIDMRPFVELGFMPQALASGDKTVFHYKGNTTPPKSYDAWRAFIELFVQHSIDRYGRAEVRQWFFEVWNEPNLGGPDSPFGFWAADRDEYFKLYEVTARAVKGVDPFLRVGGPATSNNAWIPELRSFCKETGAPLDFISTHHYPTDAVLGYGVEDSANFPNPLDMKDTQKLARLRQSAQEDGAEYKAFLQEYSVFKSHVWERVDRGVLTEMARRAKEEGGGLPLHYTEWGSLAGLESDGPFGASFIPKTVLDNIGLVDGYSFWTFSDIFEESGQASPAFFGGFGLLTQHDIAKAPYRAFQLLHRLGGQLYPTRLASGTVDGYAMKKPESGAVQLMLVNHESLLHPIEAHSVCVTLNNATQCVAATVTRVDETHANALAAWNAMGAPEYVTAGQISLLQGASALETQAIPFTQAKQALTLTLELPPMGIALVELYFER